VSSCFFGFGFWFCFFLGLIDLSSCRSRVTAFPDSNTGVSGDVDFVFRMRKDNVPLVPGLPRMGNLIFL